MKRVKFLLSIGFANSAHVEIFEYEDSVTSKEIEDDYQAWCQNYMDGDWWEVEDDES